MCPNMNVMVFERTFFEAAVQHFSHYTTEIPPHVVSSIPIEYK